MSKNIHIISGGTIAHIAPHLALCAPAYGTVGLDLRTHCYELSKLDVRLHLTRMAGGELETNDDVKALLDKLVADPDTKIIFMPVALCDFVPTVAKHGNVPEGSWAAFMQKAKVGKDAARLKTSDGPHLIQIDPAAKIIRDIRKTRKDIFLVGFKNTSSATEQEQYLAGLNLLKEASCNLVLANDTKTKLNMVITPEEAKYHVTTDRQAALGGLVEMAVLRSHLTFTRSTVVAGESVSWNSDLVYPALRTVVNHLVKRGAYKPFRGATVGHFACKLSDTEFLTSKRKTNFNDIDINGLVRIRTDGPDTVLAYGSKPSVGGQSQRIVFAEHPEYDCIVHAHVPLKPCDKVGDICKLFCHRCGSIPVVSQREFECGSHQCGQNTSTGLKKFGNLSAVYLAEHGFNVTYHHSIDPQEVINFIEANFDLEGKTGGHVS
jgi:ribulose-5-phosphate 4-epimerase/fuculose-1-phosphate aldolase